jgi:FKBP-type peptidyl-prolyl cis-trans isomerase FklB
MYKYIIVTFIMATSFAHAEVTLETKEQKLSYALGTSIATSLDKSFIGFTIDLDAFTSGVLDKNNKNTLKLSTSELEDNLHSIRNLQHDVRKKNMETIALQNLEKSNQFHAKNKKNKDITTLKSGLQYSVVTKGKGKSPNPQDSVTVHYRGTLVNGKEFDSSYSRKKPATFPLNNLIPGWQEALQLMQPGAKWKLYIPPQLAYGDSDQGVIPPNASLIFDIELISINTK